MHTKRYSCHYQNTTGKECQGKLRRSRLVEIVAQPALSQRCASFLRCFRQRPPRVRARSSCGGHLEEKTTTPHKYECKLHHICHRVGYCWNSMQPDNHHTLLIVADTSIDVSLTPTVALPCLSIHAYTINTYLLVLQLHQSLRSKGWRTWAPIVHWVANCIDATIHVKLYVHSSVCPVMPLVLYIHENTSIHT